jgi:hypothetical protein
MDDAEPTRPESRYSAQPEGFRLPESLGLDPRLERTLRDEAWRLVLGGSDDVGYFLECLEVEVDDDVGTAAFEATLAARRAQIAQWDTDGESLPLLRAFDELASIGVLARDNFSCCGSCAAGEIWDERDDSRTWRGNIHFNMQDTESLIEDGSTYLSYGVFADAYFTEAEWEALTNTQKEETYSRVVRELMRDEVFPVLRRHGITPVWDGDLSRRILVTGVDYVARV